MALDTYAIAKIVEELHVKNRFSLGFFIVNMAKDSWVHLLNISDLKLHNMPFL